MTTIILHDDDGGEVWVNPAKIVMMVHHGIGAVITLNSALPKLIVRESPAVIMELVFATQVDSQ